MSSTDEPTVAPTDLVAPWQPTQSVQAAYGQGQYGLQPPVPPGYVGYAGGPGRGAPTGPIGKVRSTWAVIGLSLITLGIYSLYYYFTTYEEMKRHSGEGVGGAIGLVLAVLVGIVTPFLLPNEVGNLYARQGRPRPVSATTGLWFLLGSLIVIGPLVWLIKTNGALNAYWRSMGAR